MTKHVERKFTVWTAKSGPQFIGLFAVPGFTSAGKVLDGEGNPRLFRSRDEALAQAALAMCTHLNQRAPAQGKAKYGRISGADFAAALTESGVTVAQFANITGNTQERVTEWCDGARLIPHYVRVLMNLLDLPDARELAMKATAAAWDEFRDGQEVEHDSD